MPALHTDRNVTSQQASSAVPNAAALFFLFSRSAPGTSTREENRRKKCAALRHAFTDSCVQAAYPYSAVLLHSGSAAVLFLQSQRMSCLRHFLSRRFTHQSLFFPMIHGFLWAIFRRLCLKALFLSGSEQPRPLYPAAQWGDRHREREEKPFPPKQGIMYCSHRNICVIFSVVPGEHQRSNPLRGY